MLRLRMFLIAAGYGDADDCDSLRTDPVFKLAVGRLPETGEPLCSQPAMSRLENAPSRIEIARMMGAMVDLFCASWKRPPASITLDIDDTLDRVQVFAKLKALLRAAAARSVEALWDVIGEAVNAFSPSECANYFKNAGYVPPTRNPL